MPAGIDHIVWPVHDLEATRITFHRLGFRDTGLGVHPFGTANYNIQLDGSFIELLGVQQPEKIPPSIAGQFNFAAFNQVFLSKREGPSMIVLTTSNALADQARFEKLGYSTFAPVHFARQAKQPGGGYAEVAFTVAFVQHPDFSELGFFSCQHHYPEHFWHPAFQQHANASRRISYIELVLDLQPERIAFLEQLFQTKSTSLINDSVELHIQNASIRLLSPASYEAKYQLHPMVDTSPFIGGVYIQLENLEYQKQQLSNKGIPYTETAQTIYCTINGTILGWLE